jgi:RNA polymerase sigma factor (sigma-70 family)
MKKLTFDIMERLYQRDNQAFDALRQQLERPIIGYARNYLDGSEAEEIFYITCSAVVLTYHNAKKEKSEAAFKAYVAQDFEKYFMQAAKNQVMKQVKDRQKHRDNATVTPEHVVEQAILPMELLEINPDILKINLAIKQLSENCRALIREHFVWGWKLVESAEERNINKDSIGSIFKRCRDKIKKRIQIKKINDGK